jgi:hypothetical protein
MLCGKFLNRIHFLVFFFLHISKQNPFSVLGNVPRLEKKELINRFFEGFFRAFLLFKEKVSLLYY